MQMLLPFLSLFFLFFLIKRQFHNPSRRWRSLIRHQNIELLKQWLQGHSYETHYRPVPIEEHLVCDGKIYRSEITATLLKTSAAKLDTGGQCSLSGLQPARLIKPSDHKELADPVRNAVVALANETVRAGYGVLVFASSRAGCESDALLISRVLPTFAEAHPWVQEKRLDLLGDLRNLSTGLDPKLEQTIPFGVAFHRRNPTRPAIALYVPVLTVRRCKLLRRSLADAELLTVQGWAHHRRTRTDRERLRPRSAQSMRRNLLPRSRYQL